MKKFLLIYSILIFPTIISAQKMRTINYRDTNIVYVELDPSFYNFSYPINSDIFNLNSFSPPDDGVYLKAGYGHRYLSNTTTKTDNHGGFDYWPNHIYQGVTYDEINKINIICMCDGIISKVITGLDAELELTAEGRSVQVTCNTISQAFGSPLKINYRHLSSLGSKPILANTTNSNSIEINKGDTIGVIGDIGLTTNVHLHLSTEANHPINGNSFVNPARLFDPTLYPHILKPLTDASIKLLHSWGNNALFRVSWPFNETINKFEFINDNYHVIFNKEEAYDTGPGNRDKHNCIPNINVFAYQFNGKQSAMSRYQIEKVNMPAIYPASPQRDSDLATYIYSHFPITYDTIGYVYDFVLENLPNSFVDDNFIVKISDVWGYTVEGTLETALGINSSETIHDNIKLYPNPTSHKIKIVFNNQNTLNKIELYNLSGKQLLKAQTYNPNETLNLSNLPLGMYILKIKSRSGIKVFKVIKK